jgi:hypothetical protein
MGGGVGVGRGKLEPKAKAAVKPKAAAKPKVVTKKIAKSNDE